MAGYVTTLRKVGTRGHVKVSPMNSRLVFSRLQARTLRGNGLSFSDNLRYVRMSRIEAAHRAQLDVYGTILYAVPDNNRLQTYSQFLRYYRSN